MQDLKRLLDKVTAAALDLLHYPVASLVMSPRYSTTEKHPKPLSLHEEYYIPGADLHFKVENTLFRVHSYFFHRESRYYRERMTRVEEAKTYDGLSDKTAIPVNTSVEEFCHFLWVFYNPNYTYVASASVWGTILTLSSPSNWDFPKMHTLALNHLSDLPLPLVEHIILYKQCSVEIDRLLPLYAELCLRDDPLTFEESIRLGHELTVPITHVRETILGGKGRGVNDNNQGSGMNTIMEEPAISKEQVVNLLKTALEIAEGFSSVMGLRRSPKCPTAQPNTCSQSRTESKPNLRVRYNKQATTNTFNDTMTAESSTQGKNRSTSSSSKGKAPAVAHAQKIFKKTVRQLGIKNNNPDVTATACVRA